MNNQLLDLGAVAVISIFAVKEFFSYLKSRKETGGNGHYFNREILEQLKNMNENHLESILKAIREGNERIVDIMHKDNLSMIQILGEIKGNLERK